MDTPRPTKRNLIAAVAWSIFLAGGVLAWYTYLSKSRVASYRFPVRPVPDLRPLIEDLERRFKRDPTTGLDRAALASVYVSKAKMTGDEASYDTAHALALKSLALLPVENHLAKMVLAQIAAARHRFAESIQLAEEIPKEQSGTDVLALKASSYLAMGKVTEAMSTADRLVGRHPALFSYGLRALIFHASGRDAEAERDYRQGLALEEAGETMESARTRALFARFLLKFGRISEARDLLTEALRIVPGMPLALDQMGALEEQRGNFKGAAALFMQAFAVSRQILYFHHYGKAKLLAGDTVTAQGVFKETEAILRSELARNSGGHRAELAQLLLDAGKKDGVGEAISLLKEELKSRQSADILKTLALAYERAENWREGSLVVQRILRSGVRDPAVNRLASRLKARLGEVE